MERLDEIWEQVAEASLLVEAVVDRALADGDLSAASAAVLGCIIEPRRRLDEYRCKPALEQWDHDYIHSLTESLDRLDRRIALCAWAVTEG